MEAKALVQMNDCFNLIKPKFQPPLDPGFRPPVLAEKIAMQLPDEKNRRVGQAIAAASLPDINIKGSGTFRALNVPLPFNKGDNP
ncbi:MAG: hypothetical protein ACERK6_11315 [Candidatus Aminicenantaceae bacterium]